MTPAVSVVMPVRNAARFLAEAVESILGQTFPNLELVAVDDGSEDASCDILRRYAASDSRIRLLGGPAVGIAEALNCGIRAARGALIARMDADDVARPERLARQAALMGADPAVAVLGSGCEIIDATGTVLRTVVLPTDPAAIRDELQRRNCIAHPTVLMRRDAVLAAGGYRGAFRHCEDWDLWLRLAERHPLRNLPEPLLRLREHAGQTAWRELEPRLLAELGACAAARLRARGRPDPVCGVASVTRPLLVAMGVGEAAIKRYVRRRALDASTEAMRAGARRAARAAAVLALRQRPMPWRTRCRCWLQLARTLL